MMRWMLLGCLFLAYVASGCGVTGEETAVLAPATTPTTTPSTMPPTETATPSPTLTRTPTLVPTRLPTLTPSPTTPAPTATPDPVLSLLEGLIYHRPTSFESYFVREEGEERWLTAYEAALLSQTALFNLAVVDERVFTVREQQLVALAFGETTPILPERLAGWVYGTVGEWLMVGTYELSWSVSQELGSLTAVSPTSGELIILAADRPYVLPIVAPDGSEVIYWSEGGAYSWFGEGEAVKRPFPEFRSGAISPDGQHVALLGSGSVHIFNLLTNALVYEEAVANCPGDGFCLPVWHPDSQLVAYGVYLPEQDPPFALRLTRLDGEVITLRGHHQPLFTEDGEWLIAFRRVDDEPQTVAIHIETEERRRSSFLVTPLGWAKE